MVVRHQDLKPKQIVAAYYLFPNVIISQYGLLSSKIWNNLTENPAGDLFIELLKQK
jgi:hypothetical protein